MKSSNAVALIVMGAMLVLAPIGADYLFQRNLVSLLTKEPSINAAVIPQLSTWYRIVCLLIGSFMIIFGTFVPAAAEARTRTCCYADADYEVDEEDSDDAK